MTYVEIDGERLELPKYTVALAERLRDVGSTEGIAEKAMVMHACMTDLLGADFVRDKTGSGDYVECDLCELANLFDVVNDAYSAAMRRSRADAEDARARDALGELSVLLAGAKSA